MDDQEIPKIYDPSAMEDKIYQRWETSGFFNPDHLGSDTKQRWWKRLGRSQKIETFSIVLPPPNVTGTLHVGHAVMLAIQDVMIRFARMRGKRSLWIPGTDHAAIATQNVVERKLVKEGMKDPRQELGREKFLAEVNKFAAASHDRIATQVRKMGASCDWSREAYTLDDQRSKAVRTAFVKMYHDGLIYRGSRIVNWCPRCKSTLADDEVEYREEKTPFYYFKYGPVVIGTARPETKFADKTIVVHPQDQRYQHFHKREFEVEWIDGKVYANVIADPIIDPNFGTGAMTITPAHSFEDFELARKYDLPVIPIIDENGNLTDAAGEFAGKNARESRDKIVAHLKNKGLLDRVDNDYVHNVTLCYRCGSAVEPLVSKQWFVGVDRKPKSGGSSLKERACEVVENGDITIIPDRFNKTYFQWMDNLHDWCISRQIWFGHRIPVWYCRTCHRDHAKHEQDEYWMVQMEEPKQCSRCGSTDLHQDTDTLDTWFSSALWTFSTLGWPDSAVDLKKYHPTSVLETAYDILFFWVARMIMMTTYHLGEVPFRTVYLHGLVRDEKGRKMSKSLGNVIDPLDMTEKYGADATRLSLLLGASPGNDTKLSEEKIAGFRNFTNKLWNISRYVLLTIGEVEPLSERPEPITLADRWILGELDEIIEKTTEYLERYEFSAAGELLREFTWNSFADWYLEISKMQISEDETDPSENTRQILQYCLTQLLKLWHPFMPFVTEVLWEKLGYKKFLMVSDWPEAASNIAEVNVRQFKKLQQIISAIRNIRSEYGIEPTKSISVTISAGSDAGWLIDEIGVIKYLARVGHIKVAPQLESPPQVGTAVVGNTEVSVLLADAIDVSKERERIKKAVQETRGYANHLKEKLSNKEFSARAPQAIIEADKERLRAAEEKLAILEDQLKHLN